MGGSASKTPPRRPQTSDRRVYTSNHYVPNINGTHHRPNNSNVINRAESSRHNQHYVQPLPVPAPVIVTKPPNNTKSASSNGLQCNKSPEKAELMRRRHKLEHPRRLEEIIIGQNSVKNSYRTLFSKYMVAQDIEEIIIEEPYTFNIYQLSNLVQFIELCVSLNPKLKIIKLITKPVPTQTGEKKKNNNNQMISGEAGLRELQTNLNRKQIRFLVEFDSDSHDREIM